MNMRWVTVLGVGLLWGCGVSNFDFEVSSSLGAPEISVAAAQQDGLAEIQVPVTFTAGKFARQRLVLSESYLCEPTNSLEPLAPLELGFPDGFEPSFVGGETRSVVLVNRATTNG